MGERDSSYIAFRQIHFVVVERIGDETIARVDPRPIPPGKDLENLLGSSKDSSEWFTLMISIRKIERQTK